MGVLLFWLCIIAAVLAVALLCFAVSTAWLWVPLVVAVLFLRWLFSDKERAQVAISVSVVIAFVSLLGAAIHYFFTPFGARVLTITGSVGSNDDKTFVNNRLVLVYLGRDEVTRATTQLSEDGGGDVHDGVFGLTVQMPFSLRAKDFTSSCAGAFHFSGFLDKKVRLDLGILRQEDSTCRISANRKRFGYSVRVVAADISTLPDVFREPGSTVLNDDGSISPKPERLREGPALNVNVSPGDLSFIPRPDSERTVHRDDYEIWNCNNSGPLESNLDRVWEWAQEVKSETKAGVTVDLQILAWLHIAPEIEVSNTSKTTKTVRDVYHIPVTAPPRSVAKYSVAIVEVWKSGDVVITVSGTRIQVPFEFRSHLTTHVTPVITGCAT